MKWKVITGLSPENYLPLILKSNKSLAVSWSASAEKPATKTPFLPLLDLIPYTTDYTPGSDSPSYRYTCTISNFSGFFLRMSELRLKSHVNPFSCNWSKAFETVA